MTTESDRDRDEALALLAEAVERLLADGKHPDADALAAEFSVPVADAEDVIASLLAVGDVLFANLDAEPEPELPAPALPDDYEIVEEIGRGGMGVVYRARQKSLGRTVAVKVIRPGALGFGETVKRLKKEARSLARLRHPGIVSVHEVGLAGDAVYFTMDYVDGGSLASRLKGGALHPAEAVRILAQVTSAIAHTHERGIIHRDLKPGNVLLDRDGNAWVVDFGLARDAALSVDATGTGRILGTPAYMSPEQARGGDPVREATDIYALGALLYESLTGRAPFNGRPLMDTIQAVLSEEPKPPRTINEAIPRDLETIVLKAMAKRPGARYATARALLEDLRAFSEGAPIRARRPGAISAMGRFAVRHRPALTSAALTVAALLAVFFAAVYPRMGQTAETWAASADELLKRGENRAALALYDQALAATTSRSGRKKLRTRVAQARIRCGEAVAREQLLSGDYPAAIATIDAAVTDGDAALGDERWPGGRLFFDRYRALVASGDAKAASKAIRALRSRLADEANRIEDQGPYFSFPFDVADRQFLDIAVEALNDPWPLSKFAARGILENSWNYGGTGADLQLLLGDRSISVLLQLLRAEGDLVQAPKQRDHYWELFEFCMAIAAHRRDETLEALADFVDYPAESENAKAIGMSLLARLADLPAQRAEPGVPREWAAWNPKAARELVDTWRELRTATREDALRIRLDYALAVVDSRWQRAHTGFFGENPEHQFRKWWATNRERDPRDWLAESVDLPLEIDVNDPEQLILFLRDVRADRRFRFHLLLCLAAPEDANPPLFLYDRPEPGRGLDHAWREVIEVGSPDEPWLLRVAHFRLTDADPPEILWEERRPIEVGMPISIHRVHEEFVPLSGSFSVPGLGTVPGAPQPARTSVRVEDFLLEWRADGLRLESGRIALSRSVPGGGTTSGWSAGNRSVHAGLILTPDSMEGYSGGLTREVRNSFVLAIAEPPGTDPKAWMVSDWQDKLAENIDFLAKGLAEEVVAERRQWGKFGLSYQRAIWLHPRMAAKIGLPDADRARAAFEILANARSADTSTISRARLMSGDASLCSGEGAASSLGDVAGGRDDTRTLPWWGRLFLTTTEPAIRDLAAEVLTGLDLSDPIASRLEQVIEDRGLSVPDLLRAKVSGGRRRAALSRISDGMPFFGFGAAFAVLAVVALITAVVAWRRGRVPLRSAAFLVFAGLGVIALDIRWNTVDLLPDEVGLAFAILGTLILARHAEGRSRLVAVAGFAATLLVVLASRVVPLPGILVTLTGVLTALSVLSLPWLALGLLGRHRRLYPQFLLFYGGPAAVIWGTTLYVAITSVESVTLPSDVVLPLIGVAGIFVLWAVSLLIRAAGRRAAWEQANC